MFAANFFTIKASFGRILMLKKSVTMSRHFSHITPFLKIGENFPAVGVLQRADGLPAGSAVCIANNLAITAAHCLEYISVLNSSFSLDNGQTRMPISAIYCHPGYRKRWDFNTMTYDIGLIKFINPSAVPLPVVKLNYDNVTVTDGYAVGYPREFNIVNPLHDSLEQETNPTRTISMPLSLQRLGVFSPSCYLSDTFKHVIENTIGYQFHSSTTRLVKSDYDKHNSGVYPGMSGGGLFTDKQLVGVISAGTGRINEANTIGDINYYVSVSYHQRWLEKSVQQLSGQKQQMQVLLEKVLDSQCDVVSTSPVKHMIIFKKVLTRQEGLGYCQALENMTLLPRMSTDYSLFKPSDGVRTIMIEGTIKDICTRLENHNVARQQNLHAKSMISF